MQLHNPQLVILFFGSGWLTCQIAREVPVTLPSLNSTTQDRAIHCLEGNPVVLNMFLRMM